ncbi:hypothetical protein Q7Z28_11425 [Glaesserella parasuis]|uniref:hypothetical protein n=1 Tax=Glaesserella parasuis TaxID=738 RepID=UPI0003AC4C15|nr:hypothetical protein [Glaesserella parasuis]ATW43510.1 hypothetical protein A2U20_06760 [Glaesserella parasuis D74]ATW43888.1 hypothetical protein A2U20_08875 [Glaesserella parasuis D74]EQA10448.1 hypothetical protein HPSD74_0798 [Glaesserella parasuis D74]MDP0318736.1 hypothetical protein [Glaesserella parasuis]
MQNKIEAFNQAQAEFSASYKHLKLLNEELNRQQRIFDALDVEIIEIQAQQEKGKNGEELPNAGKFLKLHQQEKELLAKQEGIQQFIQQIEHNRQCVTLDLVELKRRLIDGYSDLMESLANKAFDDLIAQISEPLSNAILTMMKSENFARVLREQENTFREDIDPFDHLMKFFFEKLTEKTEKALRTAGETASPDILKYQLNYSELDEIPDISPIKLKQQREALMQIKP